MKEKTAILNKNIIQFKICETACSLFSKQAYDEVTMNDIAESASISADLLYKYFGNKHDIILFLYQSINADWEILSGEIDSTQLHKRFEKAIRMKLQLMEPFAPMLRNIIGMVIGNDTLGFSTPRTQYVRLHGIRMMVQLIEGSEDSRKLYGRVKNLPALLYLLHWVTLFLYLQNKNPDKTIKLFAKLLKFGVNISFLLPLLPFIKDLEDWSADLLNEKYLQQNDIAANILKNVFQHRKYIIPENKSPNLESSGFEKHLPRVEVFIKRNEPVHFILPAFPAKSPNLKKVLGIYPDLSEEVALVTLNNICKEIASVYGPGARITICSDGRIFAGLVGVTDEQVTAYVTEIKKMIVDLKLENLDIINLEDLLPDLSFIEARQNVLERFSEPLENLRERVKSSEEFRNLFNGIHRFIVDDRLVLEPEKSKNKVKEEAKDIALRVIQHSNAWTRFLSYYFPESVRLSIHPHPINSEKIGIKLTKAVDDWITPWHGTIVLNEDGYVLMKKNQAEESGAKLVMKNERPYYYSLIEK
jgi:pyoverdine/dityrosine biosynthesis protein Dit1/AcrR family transcriptional regulator